MVGMKRFLQYSALCLAGLLMTSCVARPSIGGGGIPWLRATPMVNKARPHQPKRGELADDAVKATLGAIASTTGTATTTSYRVGERAWAKRSETMFTVRRVTSSQHAVAAVALRDFRQPCRRVPDSMKGVAPASGKEPKPDDRSDSLVCRNRVLASMFSKRCSPAEPDAPFDPETAPVGAASDDKLACQEPPFSEVRGRRGQSFRLAGMVNDGASAFYAAELPAPGGTAYLLVDGSGYLRRGLYLGWLDTDAPGRGADETAIELIRPPVRLESGLPMFRMENESTVSGGSGGQMHFEIAYNGLSRDSTGTHYHLIYKEYRAENPDQPIHMRDLAFKTDQRQVEVAGIDLQVDEVSESRILYTVVGE